MISIRGIPKSWKMNVLKFSKQPTIFLKLTFKTLNRSYDKDNNACNFMSKEFYMF